MAYAILPQTDAEDKESTKNRLDGVKNAPAITIKDIPVTASLLFFLNKERLLSEIGLFTCSTGVRIKITHSVISERTIQTLVYKFIGSNDGK
jgi:hypothetical protein